jgi:hypothetical protein
LGQIRTSWFGTNEKTITADTQQSAIDYLCLRAEARQRLAALTLPCSHVAVHDELDIRT